MHHDSVKLELIEWLAKLEDDETIQLLKMLKDSKPEDHSKITSPHNFVSGIICCIIDE